MFTSFNINDVVCEKDGFCEDRYRVCRITITSAKEVVYTIVSLDGQYIKKVEEASLNLAPVTPPKAEYIVDNIQVNHQICNLFKYPYNPKDLIRRTEYKFLLPEDSKHVDLMKYGGPFKITTEKA